MAMFAVLVSPSAAQAEPDTPAPPGSSSTVRCDSPPDTDGATPENRDRFVDLWSARFTDNAWRKHFITLTQVPAAIRAEGFHSLPQPTQLWLSACLVDDLLATLDEKPSAQDRERYLTGVAMIIFGKKSTEELRDELNDPAPAAPADTPPVERDLTGQQLDQMSDELAQAPSLTTARQPRTTVAAPTAQTATRIDAGLPASFSPKLTSLPLVPQVLAALDDVLQEVGKVQDRLFTLPVVNILAPLFYKICAESPTMDLACSVSVPVGVPVPADVDGDHLPDVTAQLAPTTSLLDVGARFTVQRLNNAGNLPAHVFAVYDTPVVKKRITVGIDGRASTLGRSSIVQVTLKNLIAALGGDIQLAASVTTHHPGATQALTFAVKSLVGGKSGVPATEADPLTGSVQLSPFPSTFQVGARMTHGSTKSHDTINVSTPDPTRVDAVIDQSVSPAVGVKASKRRFTATVDKLPTDVQIDLDRQGKHQSIVYTAKDEIGLVEATDTTTPDLSKPAETDHSVYQAYGVPKEMRVDLEGKVIHYESDDTIDKVYAGVERMGGDKITAEVRDIPDEATVTFDGKAATLDWDASAPITSASATAHLTGDTLGMLDPKRDFDAGLTITSIPAKWNASWADGNVLFDAPEGGIGAITANVTNHEDYDTLPGDHLAASYDDVSGDLDASLQISNLRHVEFTKVADTGTGGGFDVTTDMGDHGAFGFAGSIHTTKGDLEASGSFTNLPAKVTLHSDGGHITYTGDSNPDATISVAAGKKAALDTVPEPPKVHGVSVRDGAVGDDKAVRAKVYLTGLPSGLDLDTVKGIYTMTGYHPSVDKLIVDAVLTSLAPKPLSLQLQQGVPVADPVDLTFGPITTTTAADGSHTIALDYQTTQPLGRLQANATYDTDEAQLDISAIPAKIHVDAAFGADTKTVGIDMSQGISDITAAYKHVGDADYAASVHLHDVPKTVDITIGKASSDDGETAVDAPVFTMETDAAGLDIEAFASARITDPVDANAAVALHVTNLGKKVTAGLDGTRLHLVSTPKTDAFALEAAGRVKKDVDLRWDGGILQNHGTLNADLKIKRVTLGLTDFSDVNVRLGFTTGLDGSYGTFTFGQDSNLTVGLDDHFSVYIDWPDPLGSDTIPLVSIDRLTIPFGNVAPRWHLNQNRYGEIFDVGIFDLELASCGVRFNSRPAPGFTTSGNTFTVGRPADDGEHTPAWLITPDINLLGFSLPSFGLDIIAYFLSPYGHGLDVDPHCEWFEL
jgi:hypothetical protein